MRICEGMARCWRLWSKVGQICHTNRQNSVVLWPQRNWGVLWRTQLCLRISVWELSRVAVSVAINAIMFIVISRGWFLIFNHKRCYLIFSTIYTHLFKTEVLGDIWQSYTFRYLAIYLKLTLKNKLMTHHKAGNITFSNNHKFVIKLLNCIALGNLRYWLKYSLLLLEVSSVGYTFQKFLIVFPNTD